MSTVRLLPIMLLSLFAAAVPAQDSARKHDRGNKQAILKVELDRSKVALPCSPGQVPLAGSCNDSAVILVKVVLAEGTPKDVELNTTVSGGRILSRKGAEFQWDLAGTSPGTYTFSVSAMDANGIWGDQITQTAEFIRCSCGYIDSCPSLSLNDPDPVAAGELMEFTLKVGGGPDESLSFDWVVSAGTIESGQGTKTIRVRTDENMEGQAVSATVTVTNRRPGLACSDTAVGTGPVTAKKPK